MTATFTWSVLQMDSVPQQDNNNNVVIKVYWRCLAEQTENEIVYTKFVDRNTEVEYISDNSFVPYDQLTESIVIGWVHSKIAYTTKENVSVTVKDSTETELQSDINLQIVPPVQQLQLPWTVVVEPPADPETPVVDPPADPEIPQ